jgi:thiamine biosynthesis protein ThiS
MNVQSATIKIVVNGDPLEIPEKSALSDLLSQLKLKPELVVVELNLNILKREQVTQATLKEGDQVEIVHFVGGGASAAPRNHLSCTGIRRHASGPQRGPALSLALAPDRNLGRPKDHAPLALREGLLTPVPSGSSWRQRPAMGVATWAPPQAARAWLPGEHTFWAERRRGQSEAATLGRTNDAQSGHPKRGDGGRPHPDPVSSGRVHDSEKGAAG